MTEQNKDDFLIAQAWLRAASRILNDNANDNVLITKVVLAAILIADRLIHKGGKLLACGNGGSAADAQHLVAELVGSFGQYRPGLPVIALMADGPTLTAIANDFDYKYVFGRQVAALATSNDVLIAISTSGRSPNVLEAMRVMNFDVGGLVIGITGDVENVNPEFVELCNVDLVVKGAVNAAQVQEVHRPILHVMCALIEEEVVRKELAP